QEDPEPLPPARTTRRPFSAALARRQSASGGISPDALSSADGLEPAAVVAGDKCYRLRRTPGAGGIRLRAGIGLPPACKDRVDPRAPRPPACAGPQEPAA